MKTKNTKKPLLTLTEEFAAGTDSGRKPHPENTLKAVNAVSRRTTEPLIRAYWSGYLCQMTLDTPGSLD